MRKLLLLTIALAWATSTSAITIETVPIGDAGNPNDSSTGNRYGGVNYAYSIGKYEVTVGQYTAFLNAIAATDTHSLFYVNYAADQRVAGIARSGSSGNYTYSVVGSANHPMADVSWSDAARFANWMHNGQPTGPQGADSTEDGAYTLTGVIDLAKVSRNPGAKWFIPSESEWYKAAYYQPAAQGGDVDSYWDYPMKTNSVPYSDQPPGATPDNSTVGNFKFDDGIANGYDDGYAVTGSASSVPGQNYLTDVGAYVSSSSYYGTFDQGGSLWEWNEFVSISVRGVRGGGWTGSSLGAKSSGHFTNGAGDRIIEFGFRLATVAPEPDATVLLTIGSVAAFVVRRRKSVPHNRV